MKARKKKSIERKKAAVEKNVREVKNTVEEDVKVAESVEQEVVEAVAEPVKEVVETIEEPVEEEAVKEEVVEEPVKEEAAEEVVEESVKEETAETEEVKESVNQDEEFSRRMSRHYDELKWLYCELYQGRQDAFDDLCRNLKNIYNYRKQELKELDRRREQNPEWYKKNDIIGMMMYVDAFAGNLNGVREKLDYIQECNVNYLHLMPLLESPEGRSDGGYAVSNFRRVQPELGTMEDLEKLADECRHKGISV